MSLAMPWESQATSLWAISDVASDVSEQVPLAGVANSDVASDVPEQVAMAGRAMSDVASDVSGIAGDIASGH